MKQNLSIKEGDLTSDILINSDLHKFSKGEQEYNESCHQSDYHSVSTFDRLRTPPQAPVKNNSI